MGLGVHGSILKLECAAHRWHIFCLWHDASAALGNAGDISLLSDVTAKLARAHGAAAEQAQARGGEAVAALRSVDYMREVPLDAMLDGTVPCSACSTQHRNVQHAACDVQHTACNVQHATCNVQHAACNHSERAPMSGGQRARRNSAQTVWPCTDAGPAHLYQSYEPHGHSSRHSAAAAAGSGRQRQRQAAAAAAAG